jgi:hypothetical protein
MIDFLDQVPPPGAVRLKTEPTFEDLDLWAFGGMYMLRTTDSVIWPAWAAMVNGAGDVKCYELPIAPRLILSKVGNIVTIKVHEAGI